jgi:hypothetical protein
MSINKEAMLEWVEALESGKFRQTDGTLSNLEPGGHVSFCCLGVACEITRKHLLPNSNWKQFSRHNGRRTLQWGYAGKDEYPDQEEEDLLPAAIRRHLGLTEVEQEDFAEANDKLGLTFKEIALTTRLAFDL